MSIVTGKQIAECVFKDVEGFFFDEADFTIKKEYDSSGIQHASIKGSGSDARIRLSPEFCHLEVDNLDDLFYVAITLSHEIAHYLNRHNDHKDKGEIDITALETWADFYGAKVFMTVITYGEETQTLMFKFATNIKQDLVLSSMGNAIGALYRDTFLPNTDERYPPAIERVEIFNSGVTSFFYRLWGELKPEFTLHVLLTLLKDSGLSKVVGDHNPDWNNVSNIADRTSGIHKLLQNNESAITKGLKPLYVPVLVTNYILAPEEIGARKDKLKQDVQSIGLNLDEFIDKNA